MADVPFNTDLPPKPSRLNPRGGQRLLLTRAHIDEVSLLLPRTLYIETVAAQMGVHRQTFWQWIKAGSAESLRREDGLEPNPKWDLHVDLYYVVKKCLAVAESDYLVNIQNASIDPRNWTAAAWLLERRNPQRWGANRGELKQINQRLNEIEKNRAEPRPSDAEQKQETLPEPKPDHVLEPDE